MMFGAKNQNEEDEEERRLMTCSRDVCVASQDPSCVGKWKILIFASLSATLAFKGGKFKLIH